MIFFNPKSQNKMDENFHGRSLRPLRWNKFIPPGQMVRNESKSRQRHIYQFSCPITYEFILIPKFQHKIAEIFSLTSVKNLEMK